MPSRLRIIHGPSIPDPFENEDPYVCAENKTISKGYQGTEKYIFYFWICVFITFKCTVINHCVIFGIF